MMKRLSVGLLAAGLLTSGGLVGVSFGGPGITEAQVIELHIDVCKTPRHYLLRNHTDVVGQVTLCRSPIFDVDGERVGTNNVSCTVSDKTDWVCTHLYTLDDGPHTESGTIVAMGEYTDGAGDVFAITGGSGAYQGVGGFTVQDEGAGVNHTINLIP
ncbi:MAG TPA: hypothetical protein VFK59_06735 [Actinomycetota bacterium]|nr:hypothetical protein [Actinomycetota bacterium]